MTPTTDFAPSDSWRSLYASGLLGRFVLLCIGIWLHAADTLVTATIAPAIVEELGGVIYINWTITLYEVGAIIAGAVVPLLCRRSGIKRVLGIAATIYALGCSIAAFAPVMSELLVARLLQGAGGGMLLSLCYLAVQQWFPPSWWGRLFGIVAVIWGAGSLLGPLIGGVFAGWYGWRFTFGVFAVQAAALWLVAQVALPIDIPARPHAQSWPLRPLLLLSTSVLVIAAGSLAGSVAAGAAGCISGVALFYWAARVDHCDGSYLFPSQMLNVRDPAGAGLLMIVVLSVCTTGFWAYGPLLLKILFSTRPLISGYILAGEAVAWSLATLAVSTLAVSAHRRLIRIGVACIAAGAAGYTLMVPKGWLIGIVVCSLLQGTGFGLCWPSIVHRLTLLSDENQRSLAATAPETLQRIGYAIGAAAVGIAANTAGLSEGITIAAAKSAAFWVFAAFLPLLAVSVACAWRFTRAPSPR